MTRKNQRQMIKNKEILFEDIEESINAAIAEGSSLRQACSKQGIPPSSYLQWVQRDPERYRWYVRAKEVRAETLAYHMMELIQRTEKSRDPVEIQALRAAMDNWKWIICKFFPRAYAGHQEIRVAGQVDVADAMFTEEQITRMARAYLGLDEETVNVTPYLTYDGTDESK